MVDLADDFARCADLFSEALLLVNGRGEILTANRAARELLYGSTAPRAGEQLTDHVEEPTEKVHEYLKLCSRSRQKLPGRLTLSNTRSSDTPRKLASEGWSAGGDSQRLVMLRLLPQRDSVQRFSALNRQIENLNREVTRRVHAERTTHEQHEMLRVTLASIGDAVVTTDVEGVTTFMNPVAERLTGWSLEEAIGRPLSDIFVIRHEETGAEVESPVTKVLKHGRVVGLANHTVLIRKDGTRIPIDDSGAPIQDATGRLFGAVLVFHEITERRALEQRLTRQAEALREADRRKDEFLAMLAHELRNPLAPLHGAVQLLKMRGRAEDIEGITAMMERQTAQLTRLVDDLLDIARITRGTIQLERKPVTLNSVIEHAVETVRPVIEGRSHRLNIELPANLPALNADFTRLSQVLCNLLSNAAKFMDPGGEIDVECCTEDLNAVIVVRDRGVGMDKDLLDHAFELFVQADRSLDRREGGLGVGLTLAKTLVQMHGGELRAYSEGLGRGSEFVLRLPLESEPVRTAAAEGPRQREQPLRTRVLVVDDNADAAISLAMLLQHWGCEVATAEDGNAALLRARERRPDAVLLDIGLPGMNGYEVAETLRQLPTMADARIIAVSGYGLEADRQRAARAGFDAYLTKPVDFERLRELLER